MLKKIRIVLAVVMAVGVTLLFLDVSGALHGWLGWMAKIQLLPAVLALNVGVIVGVVAVTLLLGRVYCSVVCPLGVMQDLFAWIGGKIRKNRYRYHKGVEWLRWTVLGVTVVCGVVGLNVVVGLLAPYSAYGRIVTSLGQPVWIWINNWMAGIAERHESYAIYSVETRAVVWSTMAVAVATLVVVAGLSLWRGRLWCNSVCPVGTVLGLLSRWSLMKPVIDKEKCVECGGCGKKCKAECIDTANQRIDASRCVGCMNCMSDCKVGAIKYRATWGKKAKKESAVDGGRRKFLVTTAAVGTAVALKAEEANIDGGLAKIEEKVSTKRNTPLKPAGAKGVKIFGKRCTGCQLCVSECPQRILLPSTKLETLMQPEMSYRDGYCRVECVRCSEVCPTGAIERLTAEEKSAISIGHAVVVRENCLSARGEKCGHCAEVCPAGAVLMVEEAGSGYKVPAVDDERCIGCGKCEYLCPSRPLSAIYVEGREVHREV